MRRGWIKTTLGAVAEYVNGFPFKPEQLSETGTPVIRIKQLLDPAEPVDRTTIDVPDRCVLREGDIVFSWSGTLAVRIWTRGEAFLNQHLFRVLPSPEIDKSLLPLVIEHAIKDLIEKSHGTTMKHITKQTLLPHEIFLPPFEEQRRIVDLVASVDAFIAALEQQAETARTARNAVLSELLSAGGDDWTETTLGHVADVIGGGTPSTTKPDYWGGEIVWLTPTEVVPLDGQLILDSNRRITKEGLRNSGAQLLPVGSVILTSRASVGFVGISGVELCTNQGFQSLVPRGSVLARFLMYWIQSNRVEFESRAAGSTFKEISRSNVKSIKIHLPSLKVQQQIVEVVSSVDEMIQSTEQAAANAKTLRSGLLSDLLSGDHEIPESYDRLLGAA